jgi:hypothetical protein
MRLLFLVLGNYPATVRPNGNAQLTVERTGGSALAAADCSGWLDVVRILNDEWESEKGNGLSGGKTSSLAVVYA